MAVINKIILSDIWYLKNSCNHLRYDPKNNRNCKTSKIDIIYLLNQLKRTEHIPESLTVQCLFHDQSYSLVKITGSYYETNHKASRNKRNFQRSFMLNKKSDSGPFEGFKIANDMFTVTTDTKSILESDEQYALVEELCRATRLRPVWAEDCLKQFEWDYTKALAMFEQLKQEGKIPADAFIV